MRRGTLTRTLMALMVASDAMLTTTTAATAEHDSEWSPEEMSWVEAGDALTDL
jgi:hypothetical protein